MSIHLQWEIDRLKKSLLGLCALVEEQVQLAVRSLIEHDAELAHWVERRDSEIDQRETDLEEECLKALALHQPVASDLRFIVAAMKMNTDLERIGDLAVNIARKAAHITAHPPFPLPFDLVAMWEKTRCMLRDSLDSLVNLDSGLAHDVCVRDHVVDEMKEESRRTAEALLRREPDRAPVLLSLLAVSRNLERIADHATNIAEDVIYLVEGRISRHGRAE